MWANLCDELKIIGTSSSDTALGKIFFSAFKQDVTRILWCNACAYIIRNLNFVKGSQTMRLLYYSNIRTYTHTLRTDLGSRTRIRWCLVFFTYLIQRMWRRLSGGHLAFLRKISRRWFSDLCECAAGACFATRATCVYIILHHFNQESYPSCFLLWTFAWQWIRDASALSVTIGILNS